MNRKEIEWFASEMEKKLKENDYKGGWKKCHIWWLVNKLKDEVKELEDTIEKAFEEKDELTEISEDVISECADIANYSMMIADNISALRQCGVMPSLPTNEEIDNWGYLSKLPHMTQEGAELIKFGMTIMRDEINNRMLGNGA